MEHDYVTEFETFMNTYRVTQVSGEEIGVVIIRMAHYFGRYNLKLATATQAYAEIIKAYQEQTDATTGKAISSAKAESLAAATPEAATYELAKVHVSNLEQYLNSLKALQRGALNEFASSV